MILMEDLVGLIRQEMCISDRKQITEATMLEADLGITGDDGIELINAVDKAFNLELDSSGSRLREVFNLKENEYLFYSEGFDFWGLSELLFGSSKVKSISVGDLYHAIVNLQCKNARNAM